MTLYLLDTNAVSDIIKGHPILTKRLIAQPISAIYISAITEGELQYGLAKRPDAKRLHFAVSEFLRTINIAPWDSSVTKHYGDLRAAMESQGKILQSLDLQIAVHALSLGATLITSDKAFGMVPLLTIEDWRSN